MNDRNPHTPANPFLDSAGVPWEGRHFEPNPWREDTGDALPQISDALFRMKNRTGSVEQLMHVLPGTRLLVPLIAELGESEIGAHAQKVDKSAELSIVAVSTPDGATAIPAFTDVAAMLAWRVDARPVPVAAEKLALAAVGEGHTRVVINPATDRVALRRPQLKALATGKQWLNPATDDQVLRAFGRIFTPEPLIEAHEIRNADPCGTLQSAELEIQLALRPGLVAVELQAVLARLAMAVSQLPEVEEIDSYSFKVVSTKTS